jgi:2-keto-myo-inositol isomerase
VNDPRSTREPEHKEGAVVPVTLNFALNHMVAPRLDFPRFAALARRLAITDVEIRNDLPGVLLQDGTPATSVREAATAAGVRILTINALQRFNVWNEARAAEAAELADYARACGAAALVLCPLNDRADARDEAQRQTDLRHALAALRPILAARGITGLIEPLGFEESSLRYKRVAVDAIVAIDGADRFALLHDTFHHALSGETEIFPARTGLVHISGVEDRTLARSAIRDAHRVLVGERDVLGNLKQIHDLVAGGYGGPFSFEPFAESVHALPDVAGALSESIAFIRRAVAG